MSFSGRLRAGLLAVLFAASGNLSAQVRLPGAGAAVEAPAKKDKAQSEPNARDLRKISKKIWDRAKTSKNPHEVFMAIMLAKGFYVDALHMEGKEATPARIKEFFKADIDAVAREQAWKMARRFAEQIHLKMKTAAIPGKEAKEEIRDSLADMKSWLADAGVDTGDEEALEKAAQDLGFKPGELNVIELMMDMPPLPAIPSPLLPKPEQKKPELKKERRPGDNRPQVAFGAVVVPVAMQAGERRPQNNEVPKNFREEASEYWREAQKINPVPAYARMMSALYLFVTGFEEENRRLPSMPEINDFFSKAGGDMQPGLTVVAAIRDKAQQGAAQRRVELMLAIEGNESLEVIQKKFEKLVQWLDRAGFDTSSPEELTSGLQSIGMDPEYFEQLRQRLELLEKMEGATRVYALNALSGVNAGPA